MGRWKRIGYRGGYGFSGGAADTYADGHQPMTKAKKTLAKAVGITQRQAVDVLNFLWGGEWHHAGKYAYRIAFYDVPEATSFLNSVKSPDLT